MRIRFDSIDAEMTLGELAKGILTGSLILGAIYGLTVLAGLIG